MSSPVIFGYLGIGFLAGFTVTMMLVLWQDARRDE